MTVNKILFSIILFCFTLSVFAQAGNDTIITPNPPDAAEYPVQIADTTYTQREFAPGIKSRYEGDGFVYNIRPRAKTEWDRFWESVGRFLEDLLTMSEGGTTATVIIFRIIMILIVLGVIYMIVRSLIGKKGLWIFSRSPKSITA